MGRPKPPVEAMTPISPSSFIIPAGLIGQLIVYLNKPEGLAGFLDNDTSATIYIMAGPYQKELLQQIVSYKKDFKVIVL